MLIATYRQSERPVNNPVAILVSGLPKGVIPPFGYVPYRERVKNERKAKEAAELRQRAEAEKKERVKRKHLTKSWNNSMPSRIQSRRSGYSGRSLNCRQ
jgi:hypothetical protein